MAETRKLPPDPQSKNEERSDFAACAIRGFANSGTDWTDHDKDMVIDLLADLMHWHDRHGDPEENFMRLVEVAQDHYEEETKGDQPTTIEESRRQAEAKFCQCEPPYDSGECSRCGKRTPI